MNDKELEAVENGLSEETLKAMEEALNQVEMERNKKLTEDEIMLKYIKDSTRKEKLVAYSVVTLSPPEGVSRDRAREILKNIRENEIFASVKALKGKKDIYYYDSELMTERFATIQALIEDKDILATIASAVRHDCKVYPRPLRMKALLDSPYFYSEDEILGALARMKMSEEYTDIDTVTASNGKLCIYSSLHMSKKYAQAICEQMEVEWKNNL